MGTSIDKSFEHELADAIEEGIKRSGEVTLGPTDAAACSKSLRRSAFTMVHAADDDASAWPVFFAGHINLPEIARRFTVYQVPRHGA